MIHFVSLKPFGHYWPDEARVRPASSDGIKYVAVLDETAENQCPGSEGRM